MKRRALQHPGRWLWLFLVIPVAFGLFRLRFDVEVFDLLPTSLEAVEGLKLYQQHFADARELLVTVQAADSEHAETAAREIALALRAQSNLVSSVTWEPPWLEHPEQSGELLGYLWLNQPPADFRDLTNRLAPGQLNETLAHTREELASSMSPDQIGRLSYDPFGLTRLPETAASAAPDFAQGQGMFTSSEGDFRMIFVEASRDLRTYRDCDSWLRQIKPLVAEAVARASQGTKPIEVGYTGRPSFVSEVASSMQRDVQISVLGTAATIAILFYLAHRRLKPMLWLLTLLAIILGSTLALGGLIFGTINVVSMGFAAILLGLAVDYAVVHYQEALAHPTLTIPEIRSAIAPAIFWAAVTTISAFLVLNFGGLPGLGQLGTLVGLGVALSALIMIFEFLPPLFPNRRTRSEQAEVELEATEAREARSPEPGHGASHFRRALTLALTSIVLLASLAVLAFLGLPKIDATANALRPRNSPAYSTMDRIQKTLSKKGDPLSLVVSGDSLESVGSTLRQIDSGLKQAVSNGWVAGFNLPTPLWPIPENQTANKASASALVAERALFHQAALSNGFSETSLALSDRILDTLQISASANGVFWPTNPMSRWIFQKFAAKTSSNYFVVGLVTPTLKNGRVDHAAVASTRALLPKANTWLSGWDLHGHAIFSRVKANMWKVISPMIFLVMLSLWLAFRRPLEILLSVSALAISALFLLSFMRCIGWSWNLLNLMAVPLILGTGVDYSIFMQLALRRHHGDLRMAWLAVGRALLLCGGTAVAGFGFLGISTNAGMASLGQVCAVGIGCNMLIAIFVLPVWWSALSRPGTTGSQSGPSSGSAPPLRDSTTPNSPSAFYGVFAWRLGLTLVRFVPRRLLQPLLIQLALLYWRLARHRREVLISNLLPAVNGDRALATANGKALMRNFAIKLVDLWRYEAGLPIDDLFGPSAGWESLEKLRAEKRGVLILTCHIGNWELGAPWLAKKDIHLQVVTLAEPSEAFTRLRQASRAKWKIETLVIGSDPFAIVDVIRRLEDGAMIALLVDRPSPASGVNVDLFGQPFTAAIAAAELARASGCAILPVYLPRGENNYSAHLLPEIPYDRASLRDRATRQQLTQKIMQVFEPVIRSHVDQWYHFVPVWPSNPISTRKATG